MSGKIFLYADYHYDCWEATCPECNKEMSGCCFEEQELECRSCGYRCYVIAFPFDEDEGDYDFVIEVVVMDKKSVIKEEDQPKRVATPTVVSVATTEKIKDELKERFKVEDIDK